MRTDRMPRVPLVKLTELRGRIAGYMGVWGSNVMYRKFYEKGWIPLKTDGEYLDLPGFRRAYEIVKADIERTPEAIAVRFLYRCAVAAAKESRGGRHTMREVKNMLGVHEATIRDVLINHGDI